MPEHKELKPGDKFKLGPYFNLEVLQKEDGVYAFVRTGEATMVLPWRNIEGTIEVCLLRQERIDTAGKSILKVCGGYDGERSKDEAGLAHLLKKTGYAPDKNSIIWWRKSVGVGPQYDFPISYGFLKEPRLVAEPTAPHCSAVWMELSVASRLATAPDTEFFDELSANMLFILTTNHELYQ